jgi:hypothetical protein
MKGNTNENAPLIGSSWQQFADSGRHFRDAAIIAAMTRLKNRSLMRCIDVGLRADMKSPKGSSDLKQLIYRYINRCKFIGIAIAGA